MRTEAQRNASRLNGAKSRGPVTPAGKAASSANALKHGLRAESTIITGESSAAFAELSARLHAEFAPRTATETHYLETMIMCRWRLRRVWELESATLNHEIDRIPPAADAHTHRTRAAIAFRNLADRSRALDLMSRYETRHAREFIRAHKALVELQSKPVAEWSDENLRTSEPLSEPRAEASGPPDSTYPPPDVAKDDTPDPPATEFLPNEILPKEPKPDPGPVLSTAHAHELDRLAAVKDLFRDRKQSWRLWGRMESGGHAFERVQPTVGRPAVRIPLAGCTARKMSLSWLRSALRPATSEPALVYIT